MARDGWWCPECGYTLRGLSFGIPTRVLLHEQDNPGHRMRVDW